MLKDAIIYLNSVLTATGYFDENYGLAELVRKNVGGNLQRFPAVYSGQNNYDKITDFDSRAGVTYWRLRSPYSQSDIRVGPKANALQSRTYPLKLVVNAKRDNLNVANDDAYTEDKLSLAVQKALRDQEKTLRQNLNAYKVTLTFGEVVTDADEVIQTEFIEISTQKRSKYLFISIDVDLTVEIPKSCIANFTDTDVSAPTNLTATAGNSSITLTWTDNSSNETGFQVYRSTSIDTGWTKIANAAADATTYEDSTAVTGTTYFYKVRSYLNNVNSAFSNIDAAKIVSAACDDGSVTLNGGDVIANDVPSGGTKDITVVCQFDNPVGSVVAGVVVIGDSTVTLGDGGGAIYDDIPAQGTKAITVEDQDANDITSDSSTDGAGTVTVPIYNTANSGKTGQTTSYATGDDGDREDGRGAGFTTLSFNNVFGNTNRFTDTAGGQTYTNGIIIDHLYWNQKDNTIPGYYTDDTTSTIWATQVTNAAAVSIGSFTTGWHLCNIREMFSISTFSGSGINYSPFNLSGNYWTSTTDPTETARAYYGGAGNRDAYVASSLKTANRKYLAVRYFTWNGSSLT